MLCSPVLEVKSKIGGDFCGVKFIHELGDVWGLGVMGRKGMELLSSLVVFPALAAQGAGVSQKIMSFFPCTTNSCPSAPTCSLMYSLQLPPAPSLHPSLWLCWQEASEMLLIFQHTPKNTTKALL